MISDARLHSLKTLATDAVKGSRNGETVPDLRAAVNELVDEVLQLRRQNLELTQQATAARYGNHC